NSLHDRFLAELVKRGVPLSAGKTVAAMRGILEEVRAEGDLRAYVDAYALRGEIDPLRFTPAVRQAMVDYLEAIGIRVDKANFNNGAYDEYFAQAYHQATFARNGGAFPAQSV